LLSKYTAHRCGQHQSTAFIGGVFAVMYFLLIAPQRKRETARRHARTLEVGDEIVTQGGIIGRVVSIRDDPW
jgi:preprotein translocase subunit YajC